MKLIRTSLVLAIVTATSLVSGCADRGATSGPARAAGTTIGTSMSSNAVDPPATYNGAVTTSYSLHSGQVLIDAPRTGDAASVTWQTALDVCADGSGVCASDVPATISLARVTTLNAGQTNSDGSSTLLINDALTYVITWSGTKCSLVGGPKLHASSTQTAAPSTCTLVDFVSASTGKYDYALQGANL